MVSPPDRLPATVKQFGGGPWRRRAVALLVALAAASASGCASTDVANPTPANSDGETSPSSTIALSETIDHVHGLVVAADGDLRAGTHAGVVAVAPTGDVSRIGQGQDDLMGMTGVPGTDQLLTSGHPGPGSDLQNPLGVMASQDGGVTWSSLGMAGEADFHVLATDGTLVVGFAGGSGLLVSTDGGKTFSPGAALTPGSLAVTPRGVWATTLGGLKLSTDGGLSFDLVSSAPVLVIVAAGADGSLWGIDIDGYAWRSRDGAVWDRRARIEAIEALAAADYDTAYGITQDFVRIFG